MDEEIINKEEIKEKTEQKIVKRSKVKIILDLPRELCVHLIGEDYTHTHHVCAGLIFMLFGVGLVKVTLIVFDNGIIHLVGDIVGYGIHGIGLTPFVESMTNSDKIKKE